MKIVSFDIGLRNLSFCVMEGTSRSNLQIKYWNLIDVMSESAGLDAIKCFKCRKPANWTNGTATACTIHKPKSGKKITKTELGKKSLDILCQEGGKQFKTKKEAVDFLYTKNAENVWSRCVKSTKAVSIVDLSVPIAQCLEARKDMWKNADLVICEQQPDRRMLCVQSMIHMWFVCNGYHCRGISAIHKLTNIVTLDDSTKTYKGRKKTGIVHATQLVTDPEWRKYMLTHPKKDDLADAFLQAVYAVEHSKSFR